MVEDGCEGEGTLDVLNDVVSFYPGEINTQSFEYQGMPLMLRAYVKDIKSDGSYVFAMHDMITEYEDDVRVNDLSTTPVSPVCCLTRCRACLAFRLSAAKVSLSPWLQPPAWNSAT